MEKSWPWDTVVGLGDGSAELNEALSREFLSLYFGVQNPAIEGVSKGVMNELAVTGIATPLSVATGSAICYGLYRNTAVVTLAVTMPAVGTTGGRVVLQTNWAGTGGAPLEARTRLAVKMSADGNPAIPALTQAFGTTWEISLATFTVTTGGVITVTDNRTFRRSTAMVDTAEIHDLAVETAKINDLAVTTGKLNNLAVTEGKIGNLAVTEGKIGALAVTSGKIGANAVIAGKLANGAVDSYARLADNVVTDAKLRDSAGLSVIGRDQITGGSPADIVAGGDDLVLIRNVMTLEFGQVKAAGIATDAVTGGKIVGLAVTEGKIGNLAVTEGKIGNLAVTNGKIGNDAVDDLKVGNRVPQFYRRQGGSATDWSSQGTTTYTPTTVRMQSGVRNLIMGIGDTTLGLVITFPVAFSNVPMVLFTISSTSDETIRIHSIVETATNVTITLNRASGAASITVIMRWHAEGPE
jgi:hypothetical protein